MIGTEIGNQNPLGSPYNVVKRKNIKINTRVVAPSFEIRSRERDSGETKNIQFKRVVNFIHRH